MKFTDNHYIERHKRMSLQFWMIQIIDGEFVAFLLLAIDDKLAAKYLCWTGQRVSAQ